MSILQLSPRRVSLTMVRYKKLLAVIPYFGKVVHQGNEEKLVSVLPSVVILTLRLHLHGNRHATIISAYAPTLVSDEEEKQRFYDNLRDVLQAVPKGDKIVLTGDFNARVGKDWQTWDSLGRHGVGSMSRNGQLLLQLYTEFNLFISSTQFCHKGDHITTWMHPRSRQWHLLDHAIVRQRDMQDVCNVRTLCGCRLLY